MSQISRYVVIICHSECSYAECRFVENYNAECQYAECHHSECSYAEWPYDKSESRNAGCQYADVNMMSVSVLNVVMLNVVMLSVNILNASFWMCHYNMSLRWETLCRVCIMPLCCMSLYWLSWHPLFGSFVLRQCFASCWIFYTTVLFTKLLKTTLRSFVSLL